MDSHFQVLMVIIFHQINREDMEEVLDIHLSSEDLLVEVVVETGHQCQKEVMEDKVIGL